MKCQSCGHEIADTAIVCYRCGTPTAIPVDHHPSAPPARGGDRRRLVLIVVVVVVLAGLAFGLAWHLL